LLLPFVFIGERAGIAWIGLLIVTNKLDASKQKGPDESGPCHLRFLMLAMKRLCEACA